MAHVMALIRCRWKPAALLAEAEKGSFFSYAAGVAYQILTNYRVQGLEIDNYLTDLPVKKGLSSSAAICVLVARAFNPNIRSKNDDARRNGVRLSG